MGSGIAQVCATAGYPLIVRDVSKEALDRSKASIEKGLGKLVEKGKMTGAQKDAALSRIRWTEKLEEACQNVDLIIEAVFENLGLKQEMFRQFEKLSAPETILASNTSALPITEIAGVTHRGEKIVGIHFMNPVPLMKGVEVIPGQLTSEDTLTTALEFVRKIGKESVLAVDYAGFIVSRLLDVLMNEAVKLVEEGNKPEEIDKAMVICAGHPMGPCRLLDLVGAEIAMHGMETMEENFGERYKPHPLLRKRVLAGLLGQKTGQGFYKY